MARTALYGFETGALLAESSTSGPPSVTGSVAIESSIVRTGAYSLKLTPASGAAGYWRSVNSGTYPTIYLSFYCRITSLPATARSLLGSATDGIRLDPSGTLTLRTTSGSPATVTTTTALTDTSRWYRIGFIWNGLIGGSNNQNGIYIDGVLEAQNINGIGIAPAFGADDTVAATYTAYIDDLSIDNAALPGEVHLVMLLPTSLNAAGGWVEGDGAGTAGMAAAVATRPPPGVASASETSATNIESPTNSATDNCDMNMTTYTAAGIVPGDVINAIQAIVRNGEDIATGTKSGAVLIVSNPTQASEDTFSYGGDAGAHGAEVGNWASKAGIIQTGAVTLSTAPVLRVGKRTATNRVVCVDFMGIYVDYTTGNRYPPNPNARKINQAVNRASSY